MKHKTFISLGFFLSVILFACKKEHSTVSQKEVQTEEQTTANRMARESKKVYVSNVDELYAAINDSANIGNEIVLAPGTYLLDPNHPNGGRLELLHDMSLRGQPGNPEQVIIDATNLPNSSLIPPPRPGIPASSRTGVVRMGDGKNSLEWLTLQNDPTHRIRSLVQTDLVTTSLTRIRIAHTIIKGSSMGVSIINAFAIASGRTIVAEIEDNEIMDNTVLPFGTAIQIQNSMSATDAAIFATFRRNYIHGNPTGISVLNGSSQRCVIEMKSFDDRVEGNGMGMFLIGGVMANALPTLNNSTKVDVYGTVIKNDVGSPSPLFVEPPCDVFAAGAESYPPNGQPGLAHHNKLDINFYGCRIEGNIGSSQIIAYGGISYHPVATPVGTYNSTTIHLHGISTNATVSATPSFPVEPAGTNTISVYQ